MPFTSFESQVLTALLAGDVPQLSILRAQLAHCRPGERSFTGVGCFLDLEVDDASSAVSPSSVVISDVHLEIEELELGAAALLFVASGRLSMLEVVAYTGTWPDNPCITCIRYLTSGGLSEHRDIGELVRRIQGPTRPMMTPSD